MEIYGTIGPACADPEILYQMFSLGMTGLRLNLSHVSLEETGDTIRMIQEAAGRAGKKAGLLIDMQGPELRIGSLPLPMELGEKEIVILGSEIPVPEVFLKTISVGDQILLDDGKLLLEITRLQKGSALASVIRGGILKGRKSLAIVGKSVNTPAMTEMDLKNLKAAKKYGVTGVMQPFVRSPEDLKVLRKALKENDCEDIRIFAKIENLDGVRNLEAFFPLCDEIVIARGDLGNAMPLWELPVVQSRIAAACRKAEKPFMVVTQMLASMEHSAVPTRAEVSDIYRAVMEGAESVMVTGETAAGEYPEEVIRYLANTAFAALKEINVGK